MSGFEIAGMVLGAIPLIISSLEHYSEGVATLNNMREYECVFEDILTSFSASMGIYLDSCYKLLSPLNLPDKQMNELLDERKKEAWESKELQDALEERLGSNCKRYLALTQKLNKRISLFCKKLKLGENLAASSPITIQFGVDKLLTSEQPPWILSDGTVDIKLRKKFFKNAWTRIRGGFDSAKYAELLKDIDLDIDKVSKLTTSAVELEPLRAERRSRRQSTYWKNVRDQAQRLFESLSSRFSPCSCILPHQANLRLDVRKGYDANEDAIRFTFLFTFEKSACPTKMIPWNWRDIEIEASQCTPPITPASTSFGAGKKSAHFAPHIQVSSVSSSQVSQRSTSPSLASRIENLCNTLMSGCQPNDNDGCLGFLEDQPWQHHVYSVAGPGSLNQISETTSLKQIIYGAKSSLAPKEKCTLALTLASAVLQLHDTPWLPKSWDTQDIFILKSHAGTMLPFPYVSQTFTPSNALSTVSKRRRLVKNEMVFALGVALLELSWGRPLRSFQLSEDLNEHGMEDSMTEVSIATRLAHEIHTRELPNFARAILRCVSFNFDTFTYDFEDREFREKFFEGVVLPLQSDYEYVTGAKD